MKRLALPLVAALLLAACSNPADNSALYAPVVPPVSVGSGEQGTAAQAPAKKGTPVSWDMDLDGYEEIPKDPTYGINWVYMPKERVDANPDLILISNSGKIKMKPVEFHANTGDFKFYWVITNQVRSASGAYKCIVYFKTGEDVTFDGASCNYNYVPENYESTGYSLKFQRSHYQRGEDTLETKTTTVGSSADTFKQYYGQY